MSETVGRVLSCTLGPRMRTPGAKEREIAADDGARFTYRTTGEGRAIVFANGLAAQGSAWSALMGRLGSGYQFLQWDYRGLCEQGTVPCSPERHARDAIAILDAEGIERAAFVGWSMGTQVILEVFAAAPERVASLVLIAGGARTAWGSRSEATFPAKYLPSVLPLVERIPPGMHGFVQRLLESPEAYAWARRLGIVGESLDPDTFTMLVSDLERLSIDRYLETLRLLGSHDASRVIAAIDVPALVIAAGRDPMTSRAALERVVGGVPGAEYLVLPAATHFAPVDHADHIALRMKKFFSERGYAPVVEGALQECP